MRRRIAPCPENLQTVPKQWTRDTPCFPCGKLKAIGGIRAGAADECHLPATVGGGRHGELTVRWGREVAQVGGGGRDVRLSQSLQLPRHSHLLAVQPRQFSVGLPACTNPPTHDYDVVCNTDVTCTHREPVREHVAILLWPAMSRLGIQGPRALVQGDLCVTCATNDLFERQVALYSHRESFPALEAGDHSLH